MNHKLKKEKYDRIGHSYNSTRRADPYLAGRLFHFLAPEPDKLHLDIGCGTGSYTLALCQMGVHFIAVDPSEEMLKKAKTRTPSIHWLKGKAEALPLDSECVDGIMASLTLHHWRSMEKGLRQLVSDIRSGKIIDIMEAYENDRGDYLFVIGRK